MIVTLSQICRMAVALLVRPLPNESNHSWMTSSLRWVSFDSSMRQVLPKWGSSERSKEDFGHVCDRKKATWMIIPLSCFPGLWSKQIESTLSSGPNCTRMGRHPSWVWDNQLFRPCTRSRQKTPYIWKQQIPEDVQQKILHRIHEMVQKLIN